MHTTAGDPSDPGRADPVGELAGHKAFMRMDADRRSDSDTDASGSRISSGAPRGVDNCIPSFFPQRALLRVSRLATEHSQLLRDNHVSRRAVERAVPGRCERGWIDCVNRPRARGASVSSANDRRQG